MQEPRIPLVEGEPRSSVKISQNSKGEPAVEVKGYSNDLASLEETRLAVIAAFQATVAAVGA